MRVVVAPDSFKGSLTAAQAAASLCRGLAVGWPALEPDPAPVADGGEGTVDALVMATGGHYRERTVTGPLGQPVRARFGVLGDGRTAVVEMAAASGLTLVPAARRDPRLATSRGTGELIRAALAEGCDRLVVGIGGSATNDGGAGMAEALGVRFLDEQGRSLPPGGAALIHLAHIDMTGLDPRLAAAEVVVACDVTNPLLGPEGASTVFGPQKGASAAAVAELERALARLAQVLREDLGKDVAERPGAGAAGGMGAGLMALLNARVRPGIEVVMEFTGMESRIGRARWVVTGEGRMDGQTAYGKAPLGIARLARRLGRPAVGVAGQLGPGAEALLEEGFWALVPVAPGPLTLEETMARAAELVEAAGRRVAGLVRLGAALGGADGPGEEEVG